MRFPEPDQAAAGRRRASRAPAASSSPAGGEEADRRVMRMLQAAQRPERPAAILMLLEAASLAVMSAVHLPNDAGVAEAIICLVLLAGATALMRRTSHAHTAASLAVGFAILGFLVGLHYTIPTGGVDLAYHLTVLPLLVLTELMLLAPRRRHGGPPRQRLPTRQP